MEVQELCLAESLNFGAQPVIGSLLNLYKQIYLGVFHGGVTRRLGKLEAL